MIFPYVNNPLPLLPDAIALGAHPSGLQAQAYKILLSNIHPNLQMLYACA